MAKQRVTDWGTRFPGAKEVKGAEDWYEWDTPGQELVGVYRGTERFRNGHKSTLHTDEGVVIFSTPTLLKALLDAVAVGQTVAIVYVKEGKDTGKGNRVKEFKLFVLSA